MSKLSRIEIEIYEDEKDTYIALGLRLALLQGIYDCTYTEILDAVKEKYDDRRVVYD